MKSQTRQAVHALLKNFTRKTLINYDVEIIKKAYPFHRLFFDELSLIAFKQERSIVTKMGMQLYPELAKTIALENYKDVVLEKTVQGYVRLSTANVIGRIVSELRTNQRSPNQQQEYEEIAETYKSGNEEGQIEIRMIADIYIGDFSDGPIFAEIKAPKPNLDICAETKKKIFTFITLLREQNPKGYLAFPYNPFLTRAEYKWGFTNRIMDIRNDVLMAEEFWDMIGGPSTFDTMLSIIEDVGEEIREEKSLSPT